MRLPRLNFPNGRFSGEVSMSEREKLVEVRNLKKYFPVKSGLFQRVSGYVKAVDDVSFEIYAGETLGLVGESGCGKSTLGRTILQLIRPSAGSISIGGREMSKVRGESLRKARTQMQIIFQNPYSSLNPRQMVERTLTEPMYVHGIASGKAARDRAAELLKLVGLEPYFLGRFPSEFSGGQRQRIGIARALSVNPKFIVCDEPISSLDVSIQSQIVNLLRKLQGELGLTYLFISHDLSMVRYISDRIAVMYLGKIVEVADSLELVSKPLHPYTQALWAAIPIADPELEEKREWILLEGDVPSPLKPPSGCRFHTRCRQAMEICHQVEPEFREVEPNHRVACHLYK
jgi:oligopeptide transport system ATP-binding protein